MEAVILLARNLAKFVSQVKTENLELNVFILITRINESITLLRHIIYKC